MRKLGLFVVLYGTWIALSGHFTPFFLIAGAIAAAITVAISERMSLIDGSRYPIILSWRLPLYWAWLSWEIVKSSISITRKVLTPRMEIEPVLVSIPCNLKNDFLSVIYANSITLTPGTMSTDLNGRNIEVHALDHQDISQLKDGYMIKLIDKMDPRPSKFNGDS